MLESTLPTRSLGSAVLALVVLLAGCAGTPDIDGWRKAQFSLLAADPILQTSTRADTRSTMEQIMATRADLNLAGSRALALALVREQADDKKVLFLASRAESDAVFLFPAEDKENRNLAAWSALDYARQTDEAGGGDAESMAQLAWALGTSTHLQPMFQRAGHATETLKTIQKTLALNPDQPTALATLAILHLRLATLPWIANLMAFGAPDGSLEEAVKAARRACELRPSVENRLILAKCLIASDKKAEAARVLGESLAAKDRFPRDRELRPQTSRLRTEITTKHKMP